MKTDKMPLLKSNGKKTHLKAYDLTAYCGRFLPDAYDFDGELEDITCEVCKSSYLKWHNALMNEASKIELRKKLKV